MTVARILRDASIAVAVGLASFLAVYWLKDYTFIGDEALGLQDRAYLTRADTEASKIVPPFLLIDLSQADQYRLGYPPVAPRGLLAKLIGLAASGRPRLIVVDADLGWPGPPNEEAELKDALSAVAGKGEPPVLLIRQPFARSDGVAPDVLRPTPYDAIVERSPDIAWASALAPLDADGVTRRYTVAVPACRNGRAVLLAGVQPAACAMLEGQRSAMWLKAADAPACGTPAATPAPFVCGGYQWALDRPSATAEIAYRMRWKLPAGRTRPQTILPGRSIAVEEVETVDALDLARNASSVDPSSQFGGRVVVIGSSAEQVGDLHRTPVGMMPGMLVIANAIRSALELGPVPRSGMWLSLIGTALMSLASFFLWFWIRRVRGVGHLVFKEATAPLVSAFWIFVISVALPSAHIAEFLFPQIVVTLYLVIAAGFEEARHAA